MFIKELNLKNFRNYSTLNIEFEKGINVITGDNALGKTNILESISILSNIRSFRNITDSEIFKWGETSYFCSMSLGSPPYSRFEVGCAAVSGRIKKKAKIDGVPGKKISDYYGKFLTVILTPEDISLITGPPELRRRFFDSIICKTDAEYLNTLTEYKKIIASRNRVLRDIRDSKANAKDLDVWDDLYADRAAFILKKRIEFLKGFNSWFRDSELYISNRTDLLYMEYNSTLRSTDRDSVLKEISNKRARDVFKGYTGFGPHRDDYSMLTDDGKVFRNCASQGQIRTSSISLKIAELKLLENEMNESPVLLLDDVLGELDFNRRKRIMDLIEQKEQVIITTINDLIIKDGASGFKKFQVTGGSVIC